MGDLLLQSSGEDEHSRCRHVGHDGPRQWCSRVVPLGRVIADPLLTGVDEALRLSAPIR